jgi:hypothetical protein
MPLLRGVHRQCHGQTATQQDRGVDGAKENVQMLTAGDKAC